MKALYLRKSGRSRSDDMLQPPLTLAQRERGNAPDNRGSCINWRGSLRHCGQNALSDWFALGAHPGQACRTLKMLGRSQTLGGNVRRGGFPIFLTSPDGGLFLGLQIGAFGSRRESLSTVNGSREY